MEHSLYSGQAASLLAKLHLLSRDALHVLFDASSQERSSVGCLLVRLAPVSGEGVLHSTMSHEAWYVWCRVLRFNVQQLDDVGARKQVLDGRYVVTRNVFVC